MPPGTQGRSAATASRSGGSSRTVPVGKQVYATACRSHGAPSMTSVAHAISWHIQGSPTVRAAARSECHPNLPFSATKPGTQGRSAATASQSGGSSRTVPVGKQVYATACRSHGAPSMTSVAHAISWHIQGSPTVRAGTPIFYVYIYISIWTCKEEMNNYIHMFISNSLS